jgi:hypothetical protein
VRFILDYPPLVFLLTLLLCVFSLWFGASVMRRLRPPDETKREDFNVILGAVLTLLGLIIGFSFSMAGSRYDQRKDLEAAEANMIGTEYIRANLLPAEDALRVKQLLRDYLDQRVLFYTTRNAQAVAGINARTAQLQTQLWQAVAVPGRQALEPAVALAVSGMNEVLDSQSYSQAAWWNRLPTGAWVLMIVITMCGHAMIGNGARKIRAEPVLQMVLPVVVSVSFFIIADIDSPRGGVIRVHPENLISLAESLRVNP